MTNKKTEHTTPDGTTFKVGDTVVRVDHMGNPYVETLATVDGFTKTLMKVTQSNGENISYRLNVNSDSMNIQVLRVFTDKHRDALRIGRNARMIYGVDYYVIKRHLSDAYTTMYNKSGVRRTKAPDPDETLKLLKAAQTKLNDTITRIEEEVGGVLD